MRVYPRFNTWPNPPSSLALETEKKTQGPPEGKNPSAVRGTFDRRNTFTLQHSTPPRNLVATSMKEFQVNGSNISFALFTDVTNTMELLNSMQAGKLEPEVALLNASLIPDVFPVLTAAYKAVLAKSRESLTTRTLHSELIYNYSASKHISESLKRCGISENTTYILVARFDASHNEMKDVENLITGKEIDLEELEGRADHTQIKKHYKITNQELEKSSLADAIICRIAARDAL